MTYRITNKDLYNKLDAINRQAGFDPDNQDLFGVPNAYCLDFAYGGVRLAQYTNPAGGERDILPRGSKRECFDMMSAFYAGMIAQEKLNKA